MSVQAISWAVAQRCGNPSGKMVLYVLANYANSAGECWPSTESIANESELSIRSVLTWLQKLADLGLISIERRKTSTGTQLTNKYRLHMAEIPVKVAPADDADGNFIGGKNQEHPHAEFAPGDEAAGCNSLQSRVQMTAEPGAAAAPKPLIEPSENHQSARETISHLEFLEHYPRKHDYSTAQVRTEWVALAHKGEDMRAIVEAAKGYALRCRSNGTEERYMPRPENWLSKGHFRPSTERQASNATNLPTPDDAAGWFALLPEKIGGPVRLAASSDEFAAWQQWSKQNRGRGLPTSSGEWWFPCHWPPGHDKHVSPTAQEAAA